eukprot:TRINITY_DN32231_c0_g1_i1.p1 TRINITY_DN32231_c0_g1~~TRINITY_DN32231_c0_g1_i1.p1  ORF type:complete len:302 (+),score=71.44 TRINITY_DN32231_c0_g1_i1:60-908(+)
MAATALVDTAPVLTGEAGAGLMEAAQVSMPLRISRPALPAGLENCSELQYLLKAVGDVPSDTVVAERHPFSTHLLGPQTLSSVLSSTPRLRPHQDRLLLDMPDPLYCLQGATRTVGMAWLTGMLIGGIGGFYDGLKRRDTPSRSWRAASVVFWNFSVNQGPRRANTFAAVATTFCMFEALARFLVLRNQSMLPFKEKGWVMGRFGSADEAEMSAWQVDGRYCAPVGAAAAAVFLRVLKGGAAAQPPVLVSNALLASGAAYAYANLWDKTDYFDLAKKFADHV